MCASRVKEPEIAFDRVIRSKQAILFSSINGRASEALKRSRLLVQMLYTCDSRVQPWRAKA
jgi:hypothetical protein